MESVAFHYEYGDGFSLLSDEMRDEYARRHVMASTAILFI